MAIDANSGHTVVMMEVVVTIAIVGRRRHLHPKRTGSRSNRSMIMLMTTMIEWDQWIGQ